LIQQELEFLLKHLPLCGVSKALQALAYDQQLFSLHKRNVHQPPPPNEANLFTVWPLTWAQPQKQ